MNLPENMPNMIRRIFDDGLDEVLVFAFIFIFILLTGKASEDSGNDTAGCGILPLILIGAFLLLYFGFCREENEAEPYRSP